MKPKCKTCNYLEICDNNFDKCRYLQAHCRWCNEPIYAEKVFDVKIFWNQGWTGYPICDKCSKGLKTNGKRPMLELRNKLGLHNEDITLKRWLK